MAANPLDLLRQARPAGQSDTLDQLRQAQPRSYDALTDPLNTSFSPLSEELAYSQPSSPASEAGLADLMWPQPTPAEALAQYESATMPPAPAPMPETEEERTGFFSNVARGAGERAGDLVGQGGQLMMSQPSPFGGIIARGKELAGPLGDVFDFEGRTRSAFQAAEDLDLGYQEPDWNDVAQAEGLGGKVAEFGKYAFEQVLVSTPDMAAIVANAPAYFLSTTQRLAEERAKADGREVPTREDYVAAAGTSAAVVSMEQLGVEKVLGKLVSGASGAAPQGVKEFAARLLGLGATESLTEGGQELTEYLGTRIGTEAGVDPREAAKVTGIGAGVGAVGGATMGSPALLGEVVADRASRAREERALEAALAQRAQAEAIRAMRPENAQLEMVAPEADVGQNVQATDESSLGSMLAGPVSLQGDAGPFAMGFEEPEVQTTFGPPLEQTEPSATQPPAEGNQSAGARPISDLFGEEEPVRQQLAREAEQQAPARAERETAQREAPTVNVGDTVEVDDGSGVRTGTVTDANRPGSDYAWVQYEGEGEPRLTPRAFMRAVDSSQEPEADPFAYGGEIDRELRARQEEIAERPVYGDPLAQDDDARAFIEGFGRHLVKGGGMAFVNPRNQQAGPYEQSSSEEWRTWNQSPYRTGSMNDPFAQEILAGFGMTVDQVQNAIRKFMAGERLGVRQENLIKALLDEYRQNQAEDMRPDEEFEATETATDDDISNEVMALKEEGFPEAEIQAVLKAWEGRPNDEKLSALRRLAAGEEPGAPEAAPEPQQGARPGDTGDLLGNRNETAQEIANRQREIDERLRPEEGDLGPLFTQQGQVDIEDLAGRPEQTAAEPEPEPEQERSAQDYDSFWESIFILPDDADLDEALNSALGEGGADKFYAGAIPQDHEQRDVLTAMLKENVNTVEGLRIFLRQHEPANEDWTRLGYEAATKKAAPAEQQTETRALNQIGSTALQDDLREENPEAADALDAFFADETNNTFELRAAMEVYERLLRPGPLDSKPADADEELGRGLEASDLMRAVAWFLQNPSMESARDLQDAVYLGLQTVTGKDDPDIYGDLLEGEVFASGQDAGDLIENTLDPRTGSFDTTEFNRANGTVEFKMRVSDVFPEQDGVNLRQNAKRHKANEISQEEADLEWARQVAYAERIGREEDHSDEVIISLFDYTGKWSEPWEKAGYKVMRFDIKRGDDLTRLGDWMTEVQNELDEGQVVAGLLAAPPCTTYANAGARWWKSNHEASSDEMVAKTFGEWAVGRYDTALDYANALASSVRLAVAQTAPDFYVMENPLGRMQEQQNLPDPALIFDPYMYGDPWTKATQLWGEFDTNLPQTIVDPYMKSRTHELRGDDPDEKSARSDTPVGFAYAFFMANVNTNLDYKGEAELDQAPWEEPGALPERGLIRTSRSDSLLICSCSQKKSVERGNIPAEERYGPGASMSALANVDQKPDVVFLSSKFGLVGHDTPIPNYDEKMDAARAEEILKDPETLNRLRQQINEGQRPRRILIAAGGVYRKVLMQLIEELDAEGQFAGIDVQFAPPEIGKARGAIKKFAEGAKDRAPRGETPKKRSFRAARSNFVKNAVAELGVTEEQARKAVGVLEKSSNLILFDDGTYNLLNKSMWRNEVIRRLANDETAYGARPFEPPIAETRGEAAPDMEQDLEYDPIALKVKAGRTGSADIKITEKRDGSWIAEADITLGSGPRVSYLSPSREGADRAEAADRLAEWAAKMASDQGVGKNHIYQKIAAGIWQALEDSPGRPRPKRRPEGGGIDPAEKAALVEKANGPLHWYLDRDVFDAVPQGTIHTLNQLVPKLIGNDRFVWHSQNDIAFSVGSYRLEFQISDDGLVRFEGLIDSSRPPGSPHKERVPTKKIKSRVKDALKAAASELTAMARREGIEVKAKRRGRKVGPGPKLADVGSGLNTQPISNNPQHGVLSQIAAARAARNQASQAKRDQKRQPLMPKREVKIGASDFDTMYEDIVVRKPGESDEAYQKRQQSFVERMRTSGAGVQLRTAKKMLAARLGFAEIIIDKSMSVREALDVMLDLYNNAQTMSAKTGLPLTAIGFDGAMKFRISNKLSEQGEYGHFIPKGYQLGTFTVGVARRADSFAHEWLHALDFLMTMQKRDGETATLLSGLMMGQPGVVQTQMPQEVYDAFRALLGSMLLKDPESVNEYLARTDELHARRIDLDLAKARLKQLKAMKAKALTPTTDEAVELEGEQEPAILNPGDPGYEMWRRRRMAALHPDRLGRDQTPEEREEFTRLSKRQRIDAGRQVADEGRTRRQKNPIDREMASVRQAIKQYKAEIAAMEQALGEFIAANPSEFLKKSAQADANIGADYFSTAWEMMARSFEDWLSSKVGQESGTEAITAPPTFYASGRMNIVYPKGIDKARIGAAIETLMANLARTSYLVRTTGYGTLEAKTREIQGRPPKERPVGQDKTPLRNEDRLEAEVYEQLQRSKNPAVARAVKSVYDDAASIAKGLADAQAWAREKAMNPRETLKGLRTWARVSNLPAILTARGIVLALMSKKEYRGNSRLQHELRSWLRKIATDPGSGQYQPETYEEAVERRVKARMNLLGNMGDNHGWRDWSPEKQAQLRDYLTRSSDAQIAAARARLGYAENRLNQQVSAEERSALEAMRDDAKDELLWLNGLTEERGEVISLEEYERRLMMRMEAVLESDEMTAKNKAREIERITRMLEVNAGKKARREVMPDMKAMPDDVKAAAKQIRAFLDQEYYYAREADVPVGYANNGYLPRVLDEEAIENDRGGFLVAARRAYEDKQQMELRALDDQIVMLEGKITDLKQQLRRQEQHPLPRGEWENPVLTSLERQISALRMKRQETADLDPERQAQEYLYSLSVPDFFVYDASTPPSTFAKPRSLPPSADQLLSKYMVQDVEHIVDRYIMANARKSEYARRFGARHEKLELARDKLIAAGLDTKDLEALDITVRIATGSYRPGTGRYGAGLANALYNSGIILLLPRSLFAQLAEPMLAGVRTGSVTAGFRALGGTLLDLATNGKNSDWAIVAEFIGVVGSSASDQIIHNRFLYNQGDSQKWQNRMTRFFKATGVHGYTQASRRASAKLSHFYIQKVSQDYLNGNQKALDELKELGLNQLDARAFAEWVTKEDGVMTMDQLLAKGSEKQKAAYAVAMNRVVDQIIMNPKAVDRPTIAFSPWGRFVASVMAFQYGFQRQVVLRAVKMGKRSPMLVLPMVAPAISLMMMHFLAQLLRDIWDDPTGDRAKRRIEGAVEDPGLVFFDMVSRTGFTGAFDPVYQNLRYKFTGSGFKYEKGTAETLIGAVPGFYASSIDDILDGISSDSERSNYARRRGWESAYKLAAGTAVPLALASANVTGPLGFVLTSQATATWARKGFGEVMAPKTGYEELRAARREYARTPRGRAEAERKARLSERRKKLDRARKDAADRRKAEQLRRRINE